jgi:hypothetical protein
LALDYRRKTMVWSEALQDWTGKLCHEAGRYGCGTQRHLAAWTACARAKFAVDGGLTTV